MEELQKEEGMEEVKTEVVQESQSEEVQTSITTSVEPVFDASLNEKVLTDFLSLPR